MKRSALADALRTTAFLIMGAIAMISGGVALAVAAQWLWAISPQLLVALLAALHDAFAWASRHEVFVAVMLVWIAVGRCTRHVTSAIDRGAIRQAEASAAIERQLNMLIEAVRAISTRAGD